MALFYLRHKLALPTTPPTWAWLGPLLPSPLAKPFLSLGFTLPVTMLPQSQTRPASTHAGLSSILVYQHCLQHCPTYILVLLCQCPYHIALCPAYVSSIVVFNQHAHVHIPNSSTLRLQQRSPYCISHNSLQIFRARICFGSPQMNQPTKILTVNAP